MLPPLSECRFEGKLRGTWGLEIPNFGVNGVSGAHSLVRMRNDGMVPMRLLNVVGQETHLVRHKVGGTLVDAKEVTSTIFEAGECNWADEMILKSQFDFSHTTIEEETDSPSSSTSTGMRSQPLERISVVPRR